MQNFDKYSYYSEKAAVEKYWLMMFEQSKVNLEKVYLDEGFVFLADQLRLKDQWLRKLLFDYLVLELRVIAKCVAKNPSFFMKIISEGKGDLIRSMLGIDEAKYNLIWEETLEKLKDLFVEKQINQKLDDLVLENFFNFMVNKKHRKID